MHYSDSETQRGKSNVESFQIHWSWVLIYCYLQNPSTTQHTITSESDMLEHCRERSWCHFFFQGHLIWGNVSWSLTYCGSKVTWLHLPSHFWLFPVSTVLFSVLKANVWPNFMPLCFICLHLLYLFHVHLVFWELMWTISLIILPFFHNSALPCLSFMYLNYREHSIEMLGGGGLRPCS